MCISFKKSIFIITLFIGHVLIAQDKDLYINYLEGNYEYLINNNIKNTDNELLYTASAFAHTGFYHKADSLFSLVKNKESILYLNEKGFLRLKMYQLDQAKSDFEKALLLSKKNDNQEGMRLSMTNLALYHFAVGNYDLQLENAKKSMDLSIKLYGEISITTAGMYNNYALALSVAGNSEEVMKYYDKALSSYSSRKESFVNSLICRVYVNKSLFILGKNDYWTAEKNALKALDYINDESSNDAIFVYTTLGSIYSKTGDIEKSNGFLRKAIKFNKDAHLKERIELYNRLAENYRIEQDFKKGLIYLDSALILNKVNQKVVKTNNNILSLDAKLSSYYVKGELFHDWFFNKSLKIKHLKEASKAFKKAIGILDLERKLRVTQKDKIRIGQISKDLYDKLIKCTYQLSLNTFSKKKYEEELFLQIQQSKANVLNELINENKAIHFSGVSDDVIKKERRFKSRVLYLEQLNSVHNDNSAFKDSLTRARNIYEDFVNKLEQQYPKYYNLKYKKNEKSVSYFISQLSDNKVLCSYYLSSDKTILYTAWVTSKGLKVNSRIVGESFLGNIAAFRNHINFKVVNGFNKVAHSLYRDLIPDQKEFENKSVVFFPDSELNSIPFEALSTSKLKSYSSWSEIPFLIKETQVSYGITTSLYEQYENKELDTFSLFAPVTFKYSHNFSLSYLPYTEAEVYSIDSVLTKKKVRLFLNERATKSSLIQNLNSDVLHLATHGLIDQEKPELSKLCLYGDEENGFLYNNEIYSLKVKFDLVTISACETGLGKLSKGEGVIGLTRAWVYAGAKNLIVSYWPVNDYATSKLMTLFYSKIQNNSFSFSLQKAKIDLIDSDKYAAPYYWAGFVLVGE